MDLSYECARLQFADGRKGSCCAIEVNRRQIADDEKWQYELLFEVIIARVLGH
jgi:hypothetical protein